MALLVDLPWKDKSHLQRQSQCGKAKPIIVAGCRLPGVLPTWLASDPQRTLQRCCFFSHRGANLWRQGKQVLVGRGTFDRQVQPEPTQSEAAGELRRDWIGALVA